jgi:hypothetical protein
MAHGGPPMSTPWSPASELLVALHEPAHLALLEHQLDLVTAALARVHTGLDQPEILTEHACVMVRLLRPLQGRFETCRGILQRPPLPPGPQA